MPMYEIMYLIQPDLEGDLLEEAINKVQELLEREGARIVNLKKIGKRRLAYEINDFKEGFYVLLNVEAESAFVPVLEHFFKVTEGYLRFIVIRLEEKNSKEKENNKEVVEENVEGA
ncbi:MAG TPA: 30S ribosomal protein S6 [Firmicutes bacterium]|jgi:small subunit ribosomal protein S6|nr:30S ribosomal protein S6 [Bacillota bacterium]